MPRSDAIAHQAKRTTDREDRIKKRVNTFRNIDSTNLAYLAGIVDGEGSIGIHRTRRIRGEVTAFYYIPRISVTNTHLPLMEYIRSLLGGSIILRGNKGRLGRKDCYTWTVTNKTAGDLAEMLHPYLLVKKRQAEVVIEIENMRRDRYFFVMSDDEIRKRRELYDLAAVLNGRKR